MSTVNTNYGYKATDVGSTATTDPVNQNLLAQLQAALEQLYQFKAENAEWLSEENLNELNRLEMTMKAESAAISAYGAGGGTPMSGTVGADQGLYEPQDLQPGWNGVPADYMDTADTYGQGIVSSDPEYGEFGGTITIPSSGNPMSPTIIGYQLTDGDKELKVVSSGRDLIFTITREDGSKISYLVKDGTVRPEPIIISARGMTTPVKIDLHAAIRISDGSHQGYAYGQTTGFFVHLSDNDDTAVLSQGNDICVGYGGKDTIDGQGGNDEIYGDEWYGPDGTPGSFQEELGAGDFIKGGAGTDTIFAGGGADTVYSSDVDNPEGAESIAEWENKVDDVLSDPPDPSGWFGTTQTGGEDDWQQVEDEDGMMVISNETGNAGEITVDIPPGFTMCSGDMNADGDLILTFIGDEGTFKVKIVGFFMQNLGVGDDLNSSIPHLSIFGNDADEIIDFSRVKVTSQVISINGGAGNDIILGAMNQMLQDGVDIDTYPPVSQKTSDGELEHIKDEGIFAGETNADGDEDESTAGGLQSEVVNGQIVISDADSDDMNNPEFLNIACPEGYTGGYIMQDPVSGDIYIVFVKPTESGQAKTLVVKIDGALGYTFNDITVQKQLVEDDDEQWTTAFDLVPVSLDDQDQMLNGSLGHDLIFTQKGAKVTNDDGDDVVYGEYPNSENSNSDYIPPSSTPPADPTPPADDPIPGDTDSSGGWSDAEWKAAVEAVEGTMTDTEWTDYKEDHPTNPHPEPEED